MTTAISSGGAALSDEAGALWAALTFLGSGPEEAWEAKVRLIQELEPLKSDARVIDALVARVDDADGRVREQALISAYSGVEDATDAAAEEAENGEAEEPGGGGGAPRHPRRPCACSGE